MVAMQAPMEAFGRAALAGRTGMLSDIWETPEVLKGLLTKNMQMGEDGSYSLLVPSLRAPLKAPHTSAGQSPLEMMAKLAPAAGGHFFNKITILGCGTSAHAAVLGEYLIETIARIPVEVAYASEFRYHEAVHRPGDVVIVVSSSGETSDSLESLRKVKSSPLGAQLLTLSLVNNVESSIGRESDVCFDVMGGAEIGIASTKAFSGTVMAFALLALALGETTGNLVESEKQLLCGKLAELPKLVRQVLEREARPLRDSTDGVDGADASPSSPTMGECELWDIGCQNVLANNFIFLGRGFNFPVALEGAMKLKEIAYIHAEGYPAAEMKHGPIALIDHFMPVVCIAPRSDPTFPKIKSNIEEVKTRNGAIIVITEDGPGVAELEEISEHVIRVPTTHEYFFPLISVIPLQLLAYMMGILRGNTVDQPRMLQKSVTG